jgi:hypothetical protein
MDRLIINDNPVKIENHGAKHRLRLPEIIFCFKQISAKRNL